VGPVLFGWTGKLQVNFVLRKRTEMRKTTKSNKLKPVFRVGNYEKAGQVPEIRFDFPPGFVLVIDTREQDALFSKPPKGLFIVRDTLKFGDYSIKGFENVIAVERKSIPDLFASLGRERDRFKRELEGLKLYRWKWLVIEGQELQAIAFQRDSMLHPNVVRQSLASIELRYFISIHYEPNRKELERWLLDRFVKAYKLLREGAADTNPENLVNMYYKRDENGL
jgi:ERCC4-type nuclease